MNSKVVNFNSQSLVEKMEATEVGIDMNIPTNIPLEEQVALAIQTIYDPEISVNIYDLGLIYSININADMLVAIEMTLTAPGCPVAGMLVAQVEKVVGVLPSVNSVTVELVWDPPWTQDKMSDAAKLDLGLL